LPRVLLAWELGDNLGHVAPLAPVARRFRAAGWEVHAAVQRLDVVGTFLSGVVDRWHQAPRWPYEPARGVAPLTYADLLRPFGWSRPQDLALLLGAWRSLLDAVAPDVLVADSAPTALLAARGRDLGRILFSNGYSQPPRQEPLPALRWWAPPPAAELRAREASVVDVAQQATGDATFTCLADLFADSARLCQGTPATDAYGPVRPAGDVTWLGPSAAVEEGEPARWPEGEGPRVFAYLAGNHPSLPRMLSALERSGARALVYVRGLPAGLRRHHTGLRFADGPVRMGDLQQQADAAVCHSAAGTGAAFAAAGVPVLVLPTQLEQEMTARAASARGGVLVVRPTPEASFPEAVGSLLAPGLRETARQAAAAGAWRGPGADEVVLRAAQDLQRR
jgi:UDP:flavonoid glycosyltransferase YjiC (YdhE family)